MAADPTGCRLYRIACWWTSHVPYVHDVEAATAWIEPHLASTTPPAADLSQPKEERDGPQP